ncbi:MAG: dephospho-CoA kinase [Candidatus Cloacimonetes bacterium]|nr:dephospho-CoA kinase [Candidatus Cloacimonadota bacterium]
MRPDRPFLIALTGGIASGKSLAADWFRNKGFRVVDSDLLGHNALRQKDVVEKIKLKFGEEVFHQDEIDRKVLGELIFSDAEARQFINRLLHPVIIKCLKKIVTETEEEYLIIEIPLLFETNLEDCFDLTINISASEELRIERLHSTRGIDRHEAETRIKSQLSEQERVARADVNIINDSTPEIFQDRLEKLIMSFGERKFKDIRILPD